jgi:hypothetical protein
VKHDCPSRRQPEIRQIFDLPDIGVSNGRLLIQGMKLEQQICLGRLAAHDYVHCQQRKLA